MRVFPSRTFAHACMETINTDFSYKLLEVDEDPACLDAGSWVRVRIR